MRSWAARAGAVLGVYLVVLASAYALGDSPRPGLIALVVLAVAAVVWLVLGVTADAEPVRWLREDASPVRPRGDDARFARLRRTVDAQLDGREPGEALRGHLVVLADQRLLQRHGLSLRSDPDRCREMLGPEASAVVVGGPPYPRLTLDRIESTLTRIENL